MKKLFTSLLCLLISFFLSTTAVIAQVDTLRVNEIRLSVIGQQPYYINIPGYIENFNSRYSDVTFAYLRKLKKYKRHYLKAELSGGRLAVIDFDQRSEEFTAEGRLSYIEIFLGLERQNQFKHFGLFLAGGITGGYANYHSDFKPIELSPVVGYENTFHSFGLAAQGTAFTNISDNIYVYLTASTSLNYKILGYNQVLDDCCSDTSYLDFNMLLVDAVGIAFKF